MYACGRSHWTWVCIRSSINAFLNVCMCVWEHLFMLCARACVCVVQLPILPFIGARTICVERRLCGTCVTLRAISDSTQAERGKNVTEIFAPCSHRLEKQRIACSNWTILGQEYGEGDGHIEWDNSLRLIHTFLLFFLNLSLSVGLSLSIYLSINFYFCDSANFFGLYSHSYFL